MGSVLLVSREGEDGRGWHAAVGAAASCRSSARTSVPARIRRVDTLEGQRSERGSSPGARTASGRLEDGARRRPVASMETASTARFPALK
jgi:hypothetical protein